MNISRFPIKNNIIRFHMIPYHLQYETRDFYKEIVKPSDKVLMNREKYIREYNPYLKFHVPENLDEKLIKFYREKYNQR